MKDGLTRHFAQTLSYTCSHAHNTNLTKGILVKPLCDELSGVLEHQVKSRRTHVAIHHSRREIQYKDQMSDDCTANGSCGGEEAGILVCVYRQE